MPLSPRVDRISIELTNACDKACSFCYNHSRPQGATVWRPDEVVALVEDCAAHGVEAVSFGGGEPLQYADLSDILRRLEGSVFRSLTTNGLLLDPVLDELIASRPDKVHISLHFPGHEAERQRVIRQVHELDARGIASGINLLVRQSQLRESASAAREIAAAGIGPDRIMYLPMRGTDTPSPSEMAQVAATPRFQSMTCLLGCAGSPRFASIDWVRRVAWCSYTSSRAALQRPSYESLITALADLRLRFCGTD